MLQNEFGTCTSVQVKIPITTQTKHSVLKTSQTSYVKKVLFILFLNPSRWDRTPHYIALCCQECEYKKHNYYIHATSVYVYNSASSISHQYKRVIVVVYFIYFLPEKLFRFHRLDKTFFLDIINIHVSSSEYPFTLITDYFKVI